jgi:tripeptide aminopeptidase
MPKDNNIVILFCSLVAIPSPSGRERAVGNYIQQLLAERDIPSGFDGTGHLNDSDAGNLVARVKGNLPYTILFVAHMDTVETGERPISPRIVDNVVKSDGTTILGADNKGAVAALISALFEIQKLESHPSVVAVFTTREESGKMGSSVLDLPDAIDFSFNIDGDGSTGAFVYQTLGEIPFTLRIVGRAAHAASEPEKGINALTAAAEIIASLPIGKSESGIVVNVGKIQGGIGNNVVPEVITMSGQVHAFTQEEIDETYKNIEASVNDVCKRTGCTYELLKNPEEGAPPASLPQAHELILFAQKAAAVAGLPFSLSKGYYTTDANFLSRKYPTLNINRGGTGPHSHEESLPIESLYQLQKLILSLVSAKEL